MKHKISICVRKKYSKKTRRVVQVFPSWQLLLTGCSYLADHLHKLNLILSGKPTNLCGYFSSTCCFGEPIWLSAKSCGIILILISYFTSFHLRSKRMKPMTRSGIDEMRYNQIRKSLNFLWQLWHGFPNTIARIIKQLKRRILWLK